jgi:hypothetical protein
LRCARCCQADDNSDLLCGHPLQATATSTQSFVLLLTQAVPNPDQAGSGINSGNGAASAATALQQLRQSLASEGALAALPTTSRNFGPAALSNTGEP